jgi:hypothetical protein
MRRQGRRRTQLLYGLKKKRRYCNLKEEAVDRNLCEQLALEDAMDLK